MTNVEEPTSETPAADNENHPTEASGGDRSVAREDVTEQPQPQPQPALVPAQGEVVSERRQRPSQSLHRRSSRSDLVTGKVIDEEQRGVTARATSTRDAMGAIARRRSHIKNAMSPLTNKRKKWRRNNLDIDDDDESDRDDISPFMHGRLTVQASRMEEWDEESASTESRQIQYRLTARQPRKGRLFRILGYFGVSVGTDALYDDLGNENNGLLCCGVSPNYAAIRFINYLFRTSFLNVLFAGAVGFYIFTLAFGLLIFFSGINHPDCIHVNGQSFGESGDGNRFYDAYMLSWTTFSTVGYGLVFPSTSDTAESNYQRCVGIQILCTFESFVGILFGSFCGAILFGKVARARSFAQVIFSDPIVVRYGKGAKEEIGDDSSSDEEEVEDVSILPCPVLEFRVINRMHSTHGGELMDASLNVVCAIEEGQALTAARMEAKRAKRRAKRSRRPSANARDKILLPLPEKESLHSGHPDDAKLGHSPIKTKRSLLAVDEDLDEEIASRRVFLKIALETPDHPFFKRVWTARHVLNADSPLLRPDVRKRIADNNGFWPADLNNYAATRASVVFDQILVSLSGTSNAGANSVYAQKVYDYVDVNVGYRFANVLYRDLSDGSVRVDPTIVNDVLEQAGGGAEPLTEWDEYHDQSEVLSL